MIILEKRCQHLNPETWQPLQNCWCTIVQGLNSDGTLLLNDYFIVPWCLHGTPRYFKEYYDITKTYAITNALVLLFVKAVRYAV